MADHAAGRMLSTFELQHERGFNPGEEFHVTDESRFARDQCSRAIQRSRCQCHDLSSGAIARGSAE